jgi:hypothetical protein
LEERRTKCYHEELVRAAISFVVGFTVDPMLVLAA